MICEEDDNTSYQDLGPVNKMVNLVCRSLAEGKDSHAYKMHELKRKDFLWIGPQGMRMCGTNGSQLWDTVKSLINMYAIYLTNIPTLRYRLLLHKLWSNPVWLRTKRITRPA